MKKIFLLFFLLNFYLADAQTDWVASSSGNFANESVDIQLDATGNTYIIGYINGSSQFQNIQVPHSGGFSDIFVAKTDANGNYLWVKKFGGAQTDRGVKLALTPSNEIVIAGTFIGSMTLGTQLLQSANNSKDIFLAKLDNNGNVIWARKEGGNNNENPYGLAVDAAGNPILTGQFEGTAMIGTQTLTSQMNPTTNLRSFDFFISKYTNAGAPTWTKQATAPFDDRGMAVTTDASNEIYVTGQFSDTMNFIGQNIPNQIDNAGFIAHLNTSGDVVWFRKMSSANTLPYDIEFNGAGHLYVAGDYLGQLSVIDPSGSYSVPNPYSNKIFLVKFSTAGAYVWAKAHGSDSEISARCIAVDANNIYLSGFFKCNLDQYRDSLGTGLFQSSGFRDVYITKFNSSGSTVWRKHIGGQKEDMCLGIDVLETDHPVLTGSYTENLIFPYPANFTSTNNEFTAVLNELSPIPHIYLPGDESKNIFISRMTHTAIPTYNYYKGAPPLDSLPTLLVPNADSLDVCPGTVLCVSPQTYPIAGPLYDVTWNAPYNGLCTSSISATGMYTVLLERQDHCSGFTDSIYITYHPIPPLPGLTDDHNVNNNTQPYHDIQVCAPDTLSFSFTNVCAGCEVILTTNNLNPQTITNNAVFTGSHNAHYTVAVESEFGCTTADDFDYILDSIVDYDSIIPYLKLFQTADYSDSIIVCEGQPITFFALDSITNPTGNYESYEVVAYSENWIANNQTYPGSATHIISFPPETTGWYPITYKAIFGFINLCDTDTLHLQVTDSFYVEVIPLPETQIDIIGGTLLCPNETAFLTTTPNLSGYTWSGPAIIWTSADSDSIEITGPGLYNFNGILTDDQTGCSNPFSLYENVQEKSPPVIVSDPEDATICPFDSLYLSLLPVATGTYEWIDPNGFSIATSSGIYVDEPGYYSCIFTDEDGCAILTDPAEIFEVGDPFIEVLPGTVICNNDPIVMTALYAATTQIQWLAPLNTTASQVTVTEPGTYYCAFTQCGETIIDSVVITSGGFDVPLTASATMLCFGDTILLTTASGYSDYNWSNNVNAGARLSVTAAGSYYVQVSNSAGCTVYSDTIEIGMYPASDPPLIAGVSICALEDVNLSHNSANTLGWFSSPTGTTPLITGTTFTFTNLASDTVIYAAYLNNDCPLAFTAIQIEVTEVLGKPAITGDTSLCPGQDLLLNTPVFPGASYVWSFNGNSLSQSQTLAVPAFELAPANTIVLTISDTCSQAISTIHLNIHQFPSFSVPDSLDACIAGLVLLVPNSSESLTYSWTDGFTVWTGNPLSVPFNQLAFPLIEVTGTSAAGCETTQNTFILPVDCVASAPNVITPNGDGINDFFVIPHAQLMPGNQLSIVNRWGNIVYETSSYQNTFLGNELSEGTYFYTFYPDGKEVPDTMISGFFQLIRD
jgi:gliding motility-associated-like protein